MKRVYLNVCNLILKSEKIGSKTKLELNTLSLVKHYNINGKIFIYVKNAIHQDTIIKFYDGVFDVDMIIPTGVIGEVSETISTIKKFKNMRIVYEDTRFENKYNDGSTFILCNKESISLEEIQFILDDIKTNRELEDISKVFKKFLLKGMTLKFEEKNLMNYNKLKEEIIENIKEELIKNNNEILKEISEKLHMY